MAQMVDRLPPKPEIHCSNPVIGILLSHICLLSNCVEKTKIKKKRPGMAHFLIKIKSRNSLLTCKFSPLVADYGGCGVLKEDWFEFLVWDGLPIDYVSLDKMFYL